jgi:hypothetical protein
MAQASRHATGGVVMPEKCRLVSRDFTGHSRGL